MRNSSLAVSRVESAPRTGKLIPYGIIGSGVLCFLLLAWGHLGLGALLLPPAEAPATLTTTAGTFQATLLSAPATITVGNGTSMTLTVRDAGGHPVSTAQVQATATMVGMAGSAPDITVTNLGNGRYQFRPLFSMAGEWQLVIALHAPGQPPATATFTLGVRWH